MKTVKIQTTWGVIALTLDGDKVVACNLPYLKNTPRQPFVIEDFQCLEHLLKNYPKVGIPDGTDFQQAVWGEIRRIPRGKTRTYGEVATAIGKPKAVRAVGSACGANPLPLFIPCHRVVAQNDLGGFGSGLLWKVLLLKMEGAL
jgi:O-6-methylguanine DNA methyltransferase